jgi:hypothetical protein
MFFCRSDVVVASMHLLKNPTYFALHAPGGKASMAADAPQKRALGWVLNSFEVSYRTNIALFGDPRDEDLIRALF